MQSLTVQFPNSESLTTGLTSVFHRNDAPNRSVTILDRQPNLYLSTFPSEIVRCRFHNGQELRVFCKYEAGFQHNDHGNRGGVGYEAAVYRHLLQELRAFTPAYYGAFADGYSHDQWLVLEYLDNSQQVHLTQKDGRWTVVAAHCIGLFHAASALALSNEPIGFLKLHTPEYYRGWSSRALQFSNLLQHPLPWLSSLCEQFEHCIPDLLAAPLTVVHSECYPKNVLLCDGRIYLVDWESAAIAAGEIDLATLTEGWSEDIVRQCEREYQAARWPMGSPADFERRLNLARVYVQLRWLGNRPEWTTNESDRWRFERLRCMGEQLGLI